MCVYRYIFIHTYLNCSHPCKIPPKKIIFGSSSIWVLKAILFYQRTSSFLRHIKQGSRHKLLAFAHLVIHLVRTNLFKWSNYGDWRINIKGIVWLSLQKKAIQCQVYQFSHRAGEVKVRFKPNIKIYISTHKVGEVRHSSKPNTKMCIITHRTCAVRVRSKLSMKMYIIRMGEIRVR